MLRRMTSKAFFPALVLALAPATHVNLLFGQGSARIAGTVTDSTGGVVAGAVVTLTHSATSQVHTMTTPTSGGYTFLDVAPGSYSLGVKADGFKLFNQSGIGVQVGHAVTLNVTMELGSVNESVTILGEAPLVNTQTSTVQHTVDSKRITELPLNGRNVLQLQSLLPGVVSWGSAGQFGHVNPVFVVNGARSLMVNYVLDGATNVNSFWNVPNDYPNPDALQEFTAKTHSFSAIHGRNGGAVVEAATRSGTNEFHGTLFHFIRNDVLDARPFFAARRPAFKRNQYGATLGGPIVKNKHFFFFSWQGTKERGSPSTLNYFPLTAAEQRGDFSGLSTVVRDPLSNQPFAGNIVPASRLSSVNQRFLERFPMPAPNAANGLYTYAPSNRYDQNQYLARTDHELSSKDRLMGRFYFNNVPRKSNFGVPLSSDWFPDQPTKQFNYSASWIRTFSPTIINQAQFTYTGGYVDFNVAFPFDFGELGANVIPSTGSGTPDVILGIAGKFTTQTGPPTRDRLPTTEFKDTLSIIKGSHSIQTGFQVYRNRVNQIQDHQTGGNVNYSGIITGLSTADFILGEFDAYTQYSGFSARLRQTLPSVFFQDDMKLHPRFTLNLGVRWDPWKMYRSQNDQLSIFVPGEQSTRFPNTLPGMLYPGDPGIRDTIVPADYNNLAPRLGFAWDPFGKTRTSIRGSYGIFYDPVTRGINLNRFMLIPPFQTQITVFRANIQDPWVVEPFNGVNPYPYPSVSDDAGLRTVRVFGSQGATSFNSEMPTPYVQQWNFSVQHEVVRDYLVTVAYVGMKGTKLYHSINMNPSIFIPGGSTTGNTQQRRRYPWIGRVEQERTDAYSNHHAVQFSFEKRYSKGFTVLSNYTFGKTLGLNVGSENEGGNGPRDPGNWALDYGPLAYSIRHNFVTSFIWETPSTGLSNPFFKGVVDGWSLTGIFTARSGSPFTVAAGRDNSLTSIGRDTADLIGDPKLPSGRSRQEQISQYFNTSAFALNAPGTFGTSGLNILEGPGNYNVDFGVRKSFAIKESQGLQFRFEAYNVLNHANLGNPDANRSSPNFGRIFGVSGPRVLEFGLKYMF